MVSAGTSLISAAISGVYFLTCSLMTEKRAPDTLPVDRLVDLEGDLLEGGVVGLGPVLDRVPHLRLAVGSVADVVPVVAHQIGTVGLVLQVLDGRRCRTRSGAG